MKTTLLLKNCFRFFMLLSFLTVNFFFGYGQEELSYTVTEETFYAVEKPNNGEAITSQDILEMRPRKEVYRVTKRINGNDFEVVKETIEKDKNQPVWLPDIKKRVTNKHGTKMYDSAGNLIYDKAHFEDFKEDMDDYINLIREEISLRDLPTEADFENIELPDNVTIKVLPNGKVIITGPKKRYIDGELLDLGDVEEMIYNLDKHFVETTVKEKRRNKTIETKREQHLKLSNGKGVPGWVLHTKAHPKYSGVNLIHSKVMSDYVLNGRSLENANGNTESQLRLGNHRSTTAIAKNEMVLSPVPASSSLDVRYNISNRLQGYDVFDTSGKSVLSKVHIENQSEGQFRLNISHLNNGVYLLRLRTSGNIISERFVKQ